MNQNELDALPDVTPEIRPEKRTINGCEVIVPVQQPDPGALFQGPDDGIVICGRTGERYLVGWLNGVRVKRKSETWI